MSLSSPHFIAVKFESSDSNGTIGDAQPLCPYLQSNLCMWFWHCIIALYEHPTFISGSKSSYLQNWKNSLFQHFNGLGLKGQKLENDCLALHNVENAVDKVYYAGNKSLGNLPILLVASIMNKCLDTSLFHTPVQFHLAHWSHHPRETSYLASGTYYFLPTLSTDNILLL
ncbi:hypothetical protein K438DRAFT_1788086 [Mycena galopus ATCC 62051]|nr:hypothetical protein K438DRAFT_1788086 [Mycena galopus ATCC 62051]